MSIECNISTMKAQTDSKMLANGYVVNLEAGNRTTVKIFNQCLQSIIDTGASSSLISLRSF